MKAANNVISQFWKLAEKYHLYARIEHEPGNVPNCRWCAMYAKKVVGYGSTRSDACAEAMRKYKAGESK